MIQFQLGELIPISHRHILVAMRYVVHVASIIPIRLVRSRLTKAGFPYVAENTSPQQFTRSENIRSVYFALALIIWTRPIVTKRLIVPSLKYGSLVCFQHLIMMPHCEASSAPNSSHRLRRLMKPFRMCGENGTEKICLKWMVRDH